MRKMKELLYIFLQRLHQIFLQAPIFILERRGEPTFPLIKLQYIPKQHMIHLEVINALKPLINNIICKLTFAEYFYTLFSLSLKWLFFASEE